ncbi:MAG TPA: EAL domain-containing protein, partial [Motiliproteus sp.]
CRQTKAWQLQGYPQLKVAVNLSARQFSDPELLTLVRGALESSALSPDDLELELTESMLVEDSKQAAAVMAELRGLGIHLSIDDFGIGYSSLSYLKRFPLHTLKIDQSFVRDLSVDSEDAAIIKAIIFMTKGLGLNVIAEGIETQQQQDFLLAHGCRWGQGDLFSAPIPAADFLPWIDRHRTTFKGGWGGSDFVI